MGHEHVHFRPLADIRCSPHHALMNEASSPCYCAYLPDLAAVPMGGDGLDERVFATVEHDKVPSAGHAFAADRPDWTADRIIDFFDPARAKSAKARP